MNWTFPRVLAHRGAGVLAPENTLAALRHAAALGCRAVEFDVMAVHDDGLVLMHDTQLGRTVAGSGPVARHTANALAGMDAGAWFSARYAGEPVPVFADAARLCIALDLQMNVEIKPVPGEEARTGRLVGQACRTLPVGSVLLSSFSPVALEAARAAAPDVPRAWLVEAVPPDWQEQLACLGAIALHARADLLRDGHIRAIHASGAVLMAYTVNDPEQARRLFARGVDALCTDRPDLIGPESLGSP